MRVLNTVRMNQLIRAKHQLFRPANQLTRYAHLGGEYSEAFKASVQEGEVLGWHRGEVGEHDFPRAKREGHKRVGLLGVKLGLTNMWHKFSGEPIACTVIQVLDNHVVQSRSLAHHEEVALLVGTQNIDWPRARGDNYLLTPEATQQQERNVEKGVMCRRAGVPFKRFISKFPVSLESLLPRGTPLNVSHLRVGQFVDTLSVTKDKGFQGAMKRWGFHGMPASHGQTKTHRKMGNVAARGLARVWKGTKMPGHMGNDLLPRWALQVVRINHRLGLVYLNGPVAGPKGEAWVQIRDSFFQPKGSEPPTLPFPTSDPNAPSDPSDPSAPSDPSDPSDPLDQSDQSDPSDPSVHSAPFVQPCEEICGEMCAAGEPSLRFEFDTSRLGEHLKLSLETRKREVWDFDVPVTKQ